MGLPIMPGVVMIMGAVVAAVIVVVDFFAGPMGVRMAVCVAVFVGVHMFMRMSVGLVSVGMAVLVLVDMLMGMVVIVFVMTFHGYPLDMVQDDESPQTSGWLFNANNNTTCAFVESRPAWQPQDSVRPEIGQFGRDQGMRKILPHPTPGRQAITLGLVSRTLDKITDAEYKQSFTESEPALRKRRSPTKNQP